MRLHIDVTSCWERRGAPVGISRVVAELARVVRDLSPENRAWRYDRARGRLVAVTWPELDRLSSATPARSHRLHALVRRLPVVAPLARGFVACRRKSRRDQTGVPEFGAGDRFVFGDWVGDGARLDVYRSMIAEGATMVFYCHDVIPLLHPDFVEPETRRWFAAYLEVLLRADTRVICNSRATLADLKAVAAVAGTARVIPPGSDISLDAGRPARRRGLDRGYILYVSTIEPRKNHRLLIDAYDRLVAAGRGDLPLLVFVGRPGWMVDDLLRRIDRGIGGAAYVRILDRVSDAELRGLYAHAVFTVFPSLYEGWGMPVSEALTLGRLCISSDRGALAEAGAGFVDLLDPDDPGLWADRIAYFLDNPDALHARECAIRDGYRPRSWAEFRRDAAAAIADD